MALLISHRGNLNGIDPNNENSPRYIQRAIDLGYHVMVDTWLMGKNHLALGSDSARFPTKIEFLRQNNIICHAKDVKTLDFLLEHSIHCFAWQHDLFTLTNGGLIWNAPGRAATTRGIFTMPEWTIPDIKKIAIMPCAGICSNLISIIKQERDKIMKKPKS